MSDLSYITPITYKEAGMMLNRTHQHIASIVSNGLFTQYPSIGKERKLIKEQIELFIGKKQIRLTMLTSDELSLWTKYKDIAENSTATNQYTEVELALLVASTLHFVDTLPEEEKKNIIISFFNNWKCIIIDIRS